MNLTQLTEVETLSLGAFYLLVKRAEATITPHEFVDFMEEMYNQTIDETGEDVNLPLYLLQQRDMQFDIQEQNDLHNKK